MPPLPPPADPALDATWVALDGAGAAVGDDGAPKPAPLSGRLSSGGLLPTTAAVFPPPRTARSRARAYLESPYAHTAFQLVAGVAFMSLFVVVPAMRFPMSCQAAVLFAALVLQLSPRANAGARIMAAVVAVGMLCVGGALGGAAVSIAWAAQGAGDNSLMKTVKETLAGPPSPAKSSLLAKLAAAKSAAAGAAAGAAPPVKATPSLGVAMAFLKELPIVGGGYYGVLCACGLGVMALAAVVRCDPGNTAVGALGSLVAVLAGLVMANAGAVPVVGLKGFWKSAILDLLRAGLVAAGATLVAGAFVLPSRASTACLQSTARVLEGVGKTVSGYSGRRPAAASGKGSTADAVAKAAAPPSLTHVRSLRESREEERAAVMRAAVVAAAAPKSSSAAAATAAAKAALPDEDDATILACIRADTQPPHADAGGLSPAAQAAVAVPFPAGDARAPPVVAWRSVLAGARAELKEALFEPPALFRGGGTPFRFKRWGAVLGGVDGLIGRAAALEEVIARPGFAADAAAVRGLPGGGAAVASFQAAAAAVAAGCAAAATVLRDPPRAAAAWRARPPGLHGAGWDALQGRLVAGVTGAQASWMATLAPPPTLGKGASPMTVDPDYATAVRMRTMAHAAMLLGGVVEAVQGLEAAIIAALDLPPVAADGGGGGRDVETPDAKKEVRSGKGGEGTTQKEPNPHVLWASSLLAGLTGALVWIRLIKVATGTLPGCFTSRDARWACLSSRMVHFGIKYFVATTAALVATILLLWKFPQALFDWQLSNVLTVIAVCAQPRVEATRYNTLIQTVLVLAGGAAGYGLMSTPVASTPGALVPILLAVMFLAGHINVLAPLKQPLFLATSTFMTSLLCQYPKAGSTMFFAGKVVSTAVGSLLTMVWFSMVAPFYASTECLETLGGALEAGAGVLVTAWDDFVAGARSAEGSGAGVAMPAEAYSKTVGAGVTAPLGVVQALARDDRLPFSLPCIPDRDLITPMPPAVPAVAAAVDGMARRLAAFELATSQECWRGGGAALAPWNAGGGGGSAPAPGAAASAPPADHPSCLLSRVGAQTLVKTVDGPMRAAVAATAALASACREDLNQAGSGAAAERSLARVVEGIAATEAARVTAARALRDALPALAGAALAGKVSGAEDLALEAWTAALGSTMDAVLGAARVIASPVGRARDTYWAGVGRACC